MYVKTHAISCINLHISSSWQTVAVKYLLTPEMISKVARSIKLGLMINVCEEQSQLPNIDKS